MTALLSIEVWRDSPSSALVSVFQDGRRIDSVMVVPGDCLDLELEDDMHATVSDAARLDALADQLAGLEDVS